MNDLVLLAKALSDPTRVRIVAALQQNELCVCELSDALELSQSTLSSHLQVIRQAGLVATRKEGKWIYYGIEPSAVPLLEALFAHHKEALDTDKRLRRDAERISQRLAMREDDSCVLGFNQLDTHKGGKSKAQL